jgi:sugar-specific transcriptional regulator TrmB
MDNQINLTQIGLEENEAKIYLALLELGETTIIPLSRRAGLPRTTCYFLAEKMAKRGFVSQTTRGAHTYLSAASPEKIKELAILREQEAKTQRELAEKLIPKLLVLSEQAPEKPKIQYFSGKQGLRAILEDLLTSGAVKDYYFWSVKKCIEVVGENFIKDWVKRRIKAGIFSYAIRVKSEENLLTTFKSSRKKMREVRFAPLDSNFPAYLAVYKNRVAFITSKKEGFGLIIESDDFAATIKAIFDIVWRVSEKWNEK